jgi:hypothetical protein
VVVEFLHGNPQQTQWLADDFFNPSAHEPGTAECNRTAGVVALARRWRGSLYLERNWNGRVLVWL